MGGACRRSPQGGAARGALRPGRPRPRGPVHLGEDRRRDAASLRRRRTSAEVSAEVKAPSAEEGRGWTRHSAPRTQDTRLRVAMLSKALVVGAYQKKAEELARLPGVELTVLVPPRWTESGRTVRLERRFTQGYELVELPFLFDGHHHVHCYPTL